MDGGHTWLNVLKGPMTPPTPRMIPGLNPGWFVKRKAVRMRQVVFLVPLLCAFLAWADEPDLSPREAHLGEVKARLALTEEQAAQVKPILEEHFKTQMAILDKHGIDIGSRDGRRRLGFRKRRALRKDLDSTMTETVARLANVLSAAQLAEFENVQAELRKQLRKELRSD